ncbi:hypothetical protein [Dyella flagellata]|uniref:Glycosyltransferase RgtA/B/C/D-like domain-containing protein n=1 Tax=Dyella flagellata TaxID=1867833 RepID=A0ABQ5XCY0_9GAMM|nr:hypothetical protein [Dyella flagellata]GLQ89560.1 hypothetical protein GCM10007898_31340 [Dyella flagellata]
MTFDRANLVHRYGWVIPVLVFTSAIIFHIHLPGLYFDAVNPDFVAAQKLHPTHLHNPSATLPSKIFPILGSLYHGVQNLYVDLPIFAIFGCDVAPLRIAQASFGAVLLVAFFIVAQRLTRSTTLAMLGALGLASEIAFTASFRTQFYIVMGGATWLFVSLMLALQSNPDERVPMHRLFWSGFFAGLAAYGYFVLLFFVPGMLALVAFRPQSDRRQLIRWGCGLVAGFAPYALGYLSLVIKLHGVSPTVAFIRRMLDMLHPLQGSGTSGSNLLYAWQMARLAITNSGNDAMIFGYSLPSWWGETKFYVFAACTLILVAWSLVYSLRRRKIPSWALIGLLPLSYIVAASLLGSRLWAHHFCVLVPFVYLLPPSLVANMPIKLRMNPMMRGAVMGLAGAGCLLGNGSQQYTFHQHLARSGGEGMSTYALTQLALEARHAPSDTAYLFPEWGFFTSFGLLTENKVRFTEDVAPETLSDLRRLGYEDLRLTYWHPADRDRYAQILWEAGIPATTERTFTTLDGRPVFYWLEGRFAPGEVAPPKDGRPDRPQAAPQATAAPAAHAPAALPETAPPSDPAR